MAAVLDSVTRPVVAAKLDRLEALRGLAAMYVVVHHTLPSRYYIEGWNIATINRFGQEAVLLFFILSGFVIRYAFAKHPGQSFRDYFRRRFLRIYVPLAAVLALGYLARSYDAGQWIDPRPTQLLGNLAMLQDYADVKPNVPVGTYLGNDPLWSLAYEWWFYMLFFPVMTLVRGRDRRDALVFGTGLCACVLYCFLPIFPVRVAMYFGIWWSGAYMAERYLEGRLNGLRDVARPLLALGACAAVMALNVADKLPELGPRTPGFYPWLELRHFVSAALLIVCGVLWRRAGWPLFAALVGPFALVAPVSYTVYISHDYLMVHATYLDFIENRVLQWVAYLSVVLAASWVIERWLYPRTLRLWPARGRA